MDLSGMEDMFTHTYSENKWGSKESRSGVGSNLSYTVSFRENLVRIIQEYGVKRLFDCSCGDWNWMKEIKEFLPEYVGNDIVQDIVRNNKEKYGTDTISFVSNDMLSELKSYDDNHFDLVVCRHTLEHLPQEYCLSALEEIRRVSRYSLITSTTSHKSNEECSLDGRVARGINLSLPPYIEPIGEPVEFFSDTVDSNISVPGCRGNLYCHV